MPSQQKQLKRAAPEELQHKPKRQQLIDDLAVIKNKRDDNKAERDIIESLHTHVENQLSNLEIAHQAELEIKHAVFEKKIAQLAKEQIHINSMVVGIETACANHITRIEDTIRTMQSEITRKDDVDVARLKYYSDHFEKKHKENAEMEIMLNKNNADIEECLRNVNQVCHFLKGRHTKAVFISSTQNNLTQDIKEQDELTKQRQEELDNANLQYFLDNARKNQTLNIF